MVQFKNVKATAIRYDDKKPYHEYKLTENGTRRGQTVKEAYVEVVPGERFAVVVDIGIAFGFGGGPDARIRCSVDGMKPTSFYVSQKNVTDTYTAASLSWRRRTWEHVSEKVEDKCVKRPLVFAELQHDEAPEPTADHVAQDADTRGKIIVEIQCGTLVRAEPRSRDGNGISEAASAPIRNGKQSKAPSTVKPQKLGEGVPGDHTWTEHKFTPVKSRFHPPLRLNLIYRSRSALEQLNIIPKNSLAPNTISSPSTASDSVAVTSTSRGAPGLPLDVSGDAEQPFSREQSAPDLPPDVTGHVAQPQPEDQIAPDLAPDVTGGTEQPAPEGQNAPDLPLDVDTTTKQSPPKDRRAADSPLDAGNDTEQPQPKRQRVRDSTLGIDRDAEHPQPKKAKQEMNADGTVLSASVKTERQQLQIKSEEESKYKIQISASNTSVPQSNAPPSIEQRATKPSPIVIKDEDLVVLSAGPVSRVHSSRAQAPAQVSVAPVQHEDQAKRERKKAILKKRLEQLKIEQELLEMED